MKRRSGKGRFARAAMAAVLACGLMMPAGAFATDAGDPPR